MKLFKNILIGMVVAAAILLLVGYVVVWAVIDSKAKSIAVEQASKILDRDVEIEKVNFMPFVGVSVKGLEIKDLVSVGQMSVNVDVFKSLCNKEVAIDAIDVRNLKLTVRRKKDGSIVLPVPPVAVSTDGGSKSASTAAASGKAPAAQTPIYLGRLTVVDSNVVYLDDAQPGVTVELPIKKLQVKFFKMPFSGKTRFSLSGSLKVNGRSADDTIEAAGWIDLAKNDLDLDLQVKPVALAMFDPFIPEAYRTAQLGLAQADVAVSAIAKAVADVMNVTVAVTVPSYTFVQGYDSNPLALSARSVLDGLKGTASVARYEYAFTTKLSAPAFDQKAFQDDFMKNKSQTVGTGIALNLIRNISSSKALGASSKEQAKTAAVTDGVQGVTDALFGKKEGGKGPDLQKGLQSILGAVTAVENAGKTPVTAAVATNTTTVDATATTAATNTTTAAETATNTTSDSTQAVQAAANLIGGLFSSSSDEKK